MTTTGMSWVTAVVEDAAAAALFLQDLAGAVETPGAPAGSPDLELTRDVLMGDMVIRLVQPRHRDSRYAAVLEAGPRWYSFTLGVDDLDETTDRLSGAGISMTGRDGHRAWTDPAATLGLPIEWTDWPARQHDR